MNEVTLNEQIARALGITWEEMPPMSAWNHTDDTMYSAIIGGVQTNWHSRKADVIPDYEHDLNAVIAALESIRFRRWGVLGEVKLFHSETYFYASISSAIGGYHNSASESTVCYQEAAARALLAFLVGKQAQS